MYVSTICWVKNKYYFFTRWRIGIKTDWILTGWFDHKMWITFDFRIRRINIIKIFIIGCCTGSITTIWWVGICWLWFFRFLLGGCRISLSRCSCFWWFWLFGFLFRCGRIRSSCGRCPSSSCSSRRFLSSFLFSSVLFSSCSCLSWLWFLSWFWLFGCVWISSSFNWLLKCFWNKDLLHFNGSRYPK